MLCHKGMGIAVGISLECVPNKLGLPKKIPIYFLKLHTAYATNRNALSVHIG